MCSASVRPEGGVGMGAEALSRAVDPMWQSPGQGCSNKVRPLARLVARYRFRAAAVAAASVCHRCRRCRWHRRWDGGGCRAQSRRGSRNGCHRTPLGDASPVARAAAGIELLRARRPVPAHTVAGRPRRCTCDAGVGSAQLQCAIAPAGLQTDDSAPGGEQQTPGFARSACLGLAAADAAPPGRRCSVGPRAALGSGGSSQRQSAAWGYLASLGC